VSGPAVQARGVHKSFGDVRALHGVSFDVPRGTIVGIVGPNGCGKTTLIRTCVGRIRPDQGETRVLGEPSLRLQRPGAPRIGYMPQQGGLYPELTVRQNVAFQAALQGVPRRMRLARVDGVIERVHLADRARDRVAQLSGGMQRRASLAAALVHAPDLLFLDEPTVGVDPEVREEMWDDLHGLAREGRTLLVSTHYLGEAMRCRDVLLLRRGQVLAHDAPAALLRRTGTQDLESAFVRLVRGAR
jgi:ABC-2 type transport system ATP-binding protein